MTSHHRAPRRRSERVHRAILDATVRLLEAGGYRALTIEGVAVEAGVGKQTIYRWWPNKAALVMEAFAAAGEERVPVPDTGTVLGDLDAILVPVFAQNSDTRSGTARANKGMMAEAQLDPTFAAAYLELHRSWWGPMLTVIERGKARGEVPADVDPQDLVDLMLGASWYRVLLGHAPLDARFARWLARTAINGSATAAGSEPLTQSAPHA